MLETIPAAEDRPLDDPSDSKTIQQEHNRGRTGSTMEGLIGQNYLPTKFGFCLGKYWFCSGVVDFELVKPSFDLWKLSFTLQTQNVALAMEYAKNTNKKQKQKLKAKTKIWCKHKQTTSFWLWLWLWLLILSRPKIENVPVIPIVALTSLKKYLHLFHTYWRPMTAN